MSSPGRIKVLTCQKKLWFCQASNPARNDCQYVCRRHQSNCRIGQLSWKKLMSVERYLEWRHTSVHQESRWCNNSNVLEPWSCFHKDQSFYRRHHIRMSTFVTICQVCPTSHMVAPTTDTLGTAVIDKTYSVPQIKLKRKETAVVTYSWVIYKLLYGNVWDRKK